MTSLLSFSSRGNESFGGSHMMERHRSGNARVFYDDEGRVYYQGRDTASHDQWPQSPRSNERIHKESHYHSYDPIRDEKRRSRKSKTSGHHQHSFDALPSNGLPRKSNVYGNQNYGYSHSLNTDLEDDVRYTKTIIHHQVVDDYPLRQQPQFVRDSRGYNSFQDISRRHDGGYLSAKEARVLQSREMEPHPPHERNLPPPIPAISHGPHPPVHQRPPTPPPERPAEYGGPGYAGMERYPPQYGDGGVIVKKRILTEEKPIGWVFIITGVLLMIVGILNVLFCTDYHYYCHLWIGFLVLEMGIFGKLHNGNYRSGWKNWNYMLTGCVVSVAVLVGVALIAMTLAPTIITLTRFRQDLDGYIREVLADKPTPYVNISSVEEQQIWVCLSLDCMSVLLFLVDFLSLAAAVIVADHFWNANYDFTHKIEPFCRPRLFNPYHQLSVGQSMAFCGIITVFATTGTQWHVYWSPVWAAALAMVAGGVSAAAGKRHDKKSLSQVGIFLQVFNLLASIAAITLCTLGMLDNITKITPDNAATNSTSTASANSLEFERQWLIASACIFAITDMMILINIFYCLALLFRLIKYLCAKPSRYHNRRYSFSSGFTPVDLTYGNKYPPRPPPVDHYRPPQAYARPFDRIAPRY